MQLSEEDKRATTNVQSGLVSFFLFSKKSLDFKKQHWGKKCEKSGKSVKKVWKFWNDVAL